MLTHADVWRGIDNLAARHDLSASGLARKAVLDPTTFNKSKRTTKEGKQRWPSTESLAKILDATGSSLSEFIALMDGGPAKGAAIQRVPSAGLELAGRPGMFDRNGRPNGSHWDQVLFPDLDDPDVYALEVAGSKLEPTYRDGERLIVSPGAELRRGDRVLVKTNDGELLVMRLLRRTALKIELVPLVGATVTRTLNGGEVDWMCRIVWASQ